jgi:hypothetical protein
MPVNDSELLKTYAKVKAKSLLGIDFGEDNKKPGVVKPVVIVSLLGVGLGAAALMNMFKKKLPKLQEKLRKRSVLPTQQGMPENYFYPTAKQNMPEPNVEAAASPLTSLGKMLEALQQAIETKSYPQFIGIATRLPHLFDGVNLADQENVFENIHSSTVPATLKGMRESIANHGYDTITLNGVTAFKNLNNKIQGSPAGHIILLHANKDALVAAASRAVTAADFSPQQTRETFAVLVFENGQSTILAL